MKMMFKKTVLLVLIVLTFALAAMGSGSSSRKGDGKTSCKNCGRTPVYMSGFCQSCWEDFIDYQNKN